MSQEPGTPVRRIVTGHTADNRAVIATDGAPSRIFDDLGEPGLVFYEVWNTQETPARIDRNDSEPGEDRLTLAPPTRGTRIRVLDIPPDQPEVDFGEVFENIGGREALVADSSKSHASFHRTQSIDYGIVLSGEIVLLMDEGETVVRAGDIVVQRGTNHGWVVRTDKPCRIAFILIDGAFDDDLK